MCCSLQRQLLITTKWLPCCTCFFILSTRSLSLLLCQMMAMRNWRWSTRTGAMHTYNMLWATQRQRKTHTKLRANERLHRWGRVGCFFSLEWREFILCLSWLIVHLHCSSNISQPTHSHREEDNLIWETLSPLVVMSHHISYCFATSLYLKPFNETSLSRFWNCGVWLIKF